MSATRTTATLRVNGWTKLVLDTIPSRSDGPCLTRDQVEAIVHLLTKFGDWRVEQSTLICDGVGSWGLAPNIFGLTPCSRFGFLEMGEAVRP